MKRLRVCILTPGPIGSSPRVVKEADALHECGAAVRVVATRMLNRLEARDQALIARIAWPLERVDLRSRFQWKLRRLSQIAARAGFRATGLGVFADMGFSSFTTALRAKVYATPADVFIAHYPAALPVAAAAARLHGAQYAYDAEDFHLGDLPESEAFEFDRALVRAIEARYLPACAWTTASSPGIADAYATTYGIARPRVVLNAFPLRQAPAMFTPRGVAAPGPSIYWFSQTIGPNRGLECAVRAIGMSRTRPHLYLRGTPAGGFEAELAKLADEVGAAGHVHLLAPAEPDEMEKIAASYDLGLCAEPGHTVNNGLALSNKLFSFLLAGVAPLLSDTKAQSAFAAEAGLSAMTYPRDDAAALAALIDRLLSEPLRLEVARKQAWTLARERYTWASESAKLTELALILAAGTDRLGD